jgi:hypothetical protein
MGCGPSQVSAYITMICGNVRPLSYMYIVLLPAVSRLARPMSLWKSIAGSCGSYVGIALGIVP